jgi:hypothetical protein
MGGGCALEEKRPCRRPWRACSPRMRCVGCGHGKGWEKAEEESVSSLWSIGKLGRERELRCSGGVVDEEETWWASSREGRKRERGDKVEAGTEAAQPCFPAQVLALCRRGLARAPRWRAEQP